VLRVSAVMNPIQAASQTDLSDIRTLLQSAQLPTEDLHPSTGIHFWVVRSGQQLVGAIGLERFGNAALLRSLVVDAAHRGSGVGAELVRALEREAASSGVEQLVLLTQTAQSFFERAGYRITDRAHAPEAVRASTEFKSLCPASAVCMTKSLGLLGKVAND
jgi:amino-acid N-acetyltransferase